MEIKGILKSLLFKILPAARPAKRSKGDMYREGTLHYFFVRQEGVFNLKSKRGSLNPSMYAGALGEQNVFPEDFTWLF